MINKNHTIEDIIAYLDNRYPQLLALDFDKEKIGLSVGNIKNKVNNILLALDITSEVVDEAIQQKANLVITHHPFLFDPITKLLFDDPKTKIIHKLLNNKISVFSIHTNLDVAIGGVNDTLAQLIKLNNFVGVNEKGSFLRCGEIPEKKLFDFASEVKKILHLTGVRVAGKETEIIRRVAIIGGSGADLNNIKLALENNCDCLITSEIKLHIAQYAQSHNLALIEINHGSEHFVLEVVRNDLARKFDLENRIFVSNINTDPFIYI